MRILFDKEIPLFAEYCTQYSLDAFPFSHRDFTKELLDYYSPQALCIRSTTKITQEIIAGSCIEFIATATSGTDHIEKSIITSDSIHCVSAIGSNANAVAEYCISGILEYAHENEINVKEKTLGIIGYGNVGQRLALYASLLGMNIIAHDPPRQEKGLPFFHEHNDFLSVLKNADIISFHVPLHTSSHHSTFHYINNSNVSLLQSSQLLINAARGSIIDENCLQHNQNIPTLLFDTWEHEPNILLSLAKKCFIATPHSAGYTKNAKENATKTIVIHLLDYIGKHSHFAHTHYDITHNTSSLQASETTEHLLSTSAETARIMLSESRKLISRSNDFVHNSSIVHRIETSHFDYHRNLCLKDEELLEFVL
jgi:erythronate-4-phosphate dehydrogenase